MRHFRARAGAIAGVFLASAVPALAQDYGELPEWVVEARLATFPPLVFAGEARELKKQLAAIAGHLEVVDSGVEGARLAIVFPVTIPAPESPDLPQQWRCYGRGSRSPYMRERTRSMSLGPACRLLRTRHASWLDSVCLSGCYRLPQGRAPSSCYEAPIALNLCECRWTARNVVGAQHIWSCIALICSARSSTPSAAKRPSN